MMDDTNMHINNGLVPAFCPMKKEKRNGNHQIVQMRSEIIEQISIKRSTVLNIGIVIDL